MVFDRCAELLSKDPRYYQIAVLGSLLFYGVAWLGFDIGAPDIAILLGTVIGTQFLCTKFLSRSAFDSRSALISGLSLCFTAAYQRFNSDDSYSRDHYHQQVFTEVE
jgi:hypothetical protein